MKKFFLLISLLPVFLFSGCTHNNGDIGPLFGQWIMTEMTVDGDMPDIMVPTDWNWRFQSHVLMISHVDRTAHTDTQYWASWQQEGNTLTVNFRNTDPAIDFYYDYPRELGFTEATTYSLQIVASSSKEMTLRMVNPAGLTYVYTLKKQ